MRRLPTALRVLLGVVAGIAVGLPVVSALGLAHGTTRPRYHLVPEDGSAPLQRIAIHYVPSLDDRALPVWVALFTALPARVEVEVAVTKSEQFDRFIDELRAADVPNLDRFHAVATGSQLTTWSRDRLASLQDPAGHGAVLAPPKIDTFTAGRAGDWQAPFAISRDVYHQEARVADFVFEGGDLAASRKVLFADANLIGRNLGRGDASREHLEGELKKTFNQDIVWLGDVPGDVPQHHIMMYMVPLDDHTVAVGDVRLGMSLLGDTELSHADVDVQAARFDRAAELLHDKGFQVVRFPVIVRAGGGSYVTYTNALFDRGAPPLVGGTPTSLPNRGAPPLVGGTPTSLPNRGAPPLVGGTPTSLPNRGAPPLVGGTPTSLPNRGAPPLVGGTPTSLPNRGAPPLVGGTPTSLPNRGAPPLVGGTPTSLPNRDLAGPIVYLPTYQLPALDDYAREEYEKLGFRVVPIDVSTIYELNGSLGCLVNVMARG